jgi:hypothetical protein
MNKSGTRKPLLPRVVLLFFLAGAIPFIPTAPAQSGPAPGVHAYPVTTGIAKGAPVTVYPTVEGHSLVTWNTLSHFPYDSPDIDEEIDPQLRSKKKKYPIPDYIRRLDGASVAVVGFMIPLETNDAGDKATSFILARSQATCCYGIVPKMNEWMFVQMEKGKTADAVMDIPLTVFGTLSVGEQKKANTGWSLYRMQSDRVSVPKVNW